MSRGRFLTYTSRRLRRGHGMWLVAAAVLVVLVVPASSPAQGQHRKPSADELWQQYPLQTQPSPRATNTAAPPTNTAAPPDSGGEAAAKSNSHSSPVAAVAAITLALVLLTSLIAVLAVRSRRGSRAGDHRPLDGLQPLLGAPTLAAASAPAFDGLGSAPARMSRREDNGDMRLWPRADVPPTHGGAPPDENREWTAEVAWVEAGGMGRFRVLATSRDDGSVVAIAESKPLKWPPQDPSGVQAMSRAADALESALLSAGWKPRPPGDAWYAKRFAWTTRDEVEAEDTPPRPRRFERDAPWPDDSAELWRCELEWRPGLVNSRFQAVVFEPGSGHGQRVAASARFRWLFMGDPAPTAPEYRPELDRLTASLEAAGWERVPIGAKWFSRRFVWRHDGPPPDRIEADAAATGPSLG